MKKLELLEVLEGIEDTRRKLSVWYPLQEVLFIMLTAVICGATSYAKVEMLGKARELAEKVYKAGKWGAGCLHLSQCDQGNRYRTGTHSICGIDAECCGESHRCGGDRRQASTADQGFQESTAACGECIFRRMQFGFGTTGVRGKKQ